MRKVSQQSKTFRVKFAVGASLDTIPHQHSTVWYFHVRAFQAPSTEQHSAKNYASYISQLRQLQLFGMCELGERWLTNKDSRVWQWLLWPALDLPPPSTSFHGKKINSCKKMLLIINWDASVFSLSGIWVVHWLSKLSNAMFSATFSSSVWCTLLHKITNS